MLVVDNVVKKFRRVGNNKKIEDLYANNGISFSVDKGTIFGILGPNGAGKTTLLRMVGGILEPTSGNIKFADLDYKHNEIEIKNKIAYLSGNTKLYRSLTTYELLKMCGNIYGVKEDIIEKRIKDISKRLGMDEFLHNRIGLLSTGQTQKVNIARCLLPDPEYYILDEVTSGLDIISSQIILDFIKEERDRGKTILYSTHYMEEAENICDQLIMINKGKIIKTGTPDQIKKDTETTNLRDAFFKILGGNNE